MPETPCAFSPVDRRVTQIFALVSEALGTATHALLHGELTTGQTVIDQDKVIDSLTNDLERIVWAQLDGEHLDGLGMRRLVGILLILPELERSADLAEHIAQRAVSNLGVDMSPLSRGIVQRMTEVALEMWGSVADSFVTRAPPAIALDEVDREIDILRDRLTAEVAAETMPTAVAAQVTLLARFYERLGDHAVNLARRIANLPPITP